jgi:hypothetical protein
MFEKHLKGGFAVVINKTNLNKKGEESLKGLEISIKVPSKTHQTSIKHLTKTQRQL